ncbi:hypothetical protein TPELB_35600 [Terrisporobacter petrolearius]|uniref:Uncharacterized protein n=1 Tax=Terrisporobacter petrolearius TaxID=1460447 RepID=A0ABZ3FHD2_9FIRM
MDKIKMKIYNDISAKILEHLSNNKVKYNIKEENNHIIECINKYPQKNKNKIEIEVDERFSMRMISLLNWKEKMVYTIPRKVYISQHLLQNMNENIEESITDKIYEFKKKFEMGEDINSNLSKGIFDSNSLDYILNIWNIKHLHLSNSVELNKNKMSSNRSDYLLFFTLNNDNVYFIDVRKHPKGAGFTSFKFLEILEENNWLNIIGLNKIEDCLGLSIVIEKDEDIYELTKSGINIIYKINGAYYINVMGIALRGNKINHTSKLINIRKEINRLLDESKIEYIGFDLNLNEYLGVVKYKKNCKYYQLVLY